SANQKCRWLVFKIHDLNSQTTQPMPPDAKDLKECKESCAAMLIAELRRRFCISQGESVDKVLSDMFGVKRRTLNEANGINGVDAQEKNYIDDELLAAFNLLEPPENFLEHQWRVYKSHLRKPIAKRLSLCGKKARNDQVHTHTTGAVSFARTKDIYIIANREISSKVKELVGPEEPHCYGAGVTKSQISKFCCDPNRMRGEGLADENYFLKEKVDNQTKEIHTHKKQLEMCNKESETCKKQLASQNKKVESYKKQVETQDLDNVASTSAAGTCDKHPPSSPSPFMDEDHYSSVMDHPSFGY
nr:hypothetical protein [Tanacetum cinerariifolium]